MEMVCEQNILSIINSCFNYMLKKPPKEELFTFALDKIKLEFQLQSACFYVWDALCKNSNESCLKCAAYNSQYMSDELDTENETTSKRQVSPINILPFAIYDIYVTLKNADPPQTHYFVENRSYCLFPLLDMDGTIIAMLCIQCNENDCDGFTDETICQMMKTIPFLENMITHMTAIDEIDTTKVNFIANMSHEVRTPLNAIITMVDMLATTELKPKQIQFVDTLQSCSIQLMEIINDILDYSKIFNNCIQLKMEPFSMNKCLTSVYLMMIPKAKEKGIAFNMTTNIEIADNMVIGDSIRMKQILINLLSNAIKFTKKGNVHLCVNLLNKNIPNKTCDISFTVSDTGIGIPADNIAKIFNPFKQIENDYLNENCGVGLGLSITKHLVDLYRGTIDVQSTVNVGTTFNIQLPFTTFVDVIDSDELYKFFMNKNVLVFNTDTTERLSLINIMNDFGLRTILTVSFEETMMYLTSELFSFEFVLINNNDLTYETILKIQKVKNNTIKVIILDFDSENTVSSMCDYNLMRPVDKTKIAYVLNVIYTSHQYNITRMHNELFLPAPISSIHNSPSAQYASQKISLINSNTHENYLGIKNIKILVAEDNRSNQIVMRELLQSLGYDDIIIASDGMDAYTQMISNQFDIVFMDLKMPIMNGLDATIKYKEYINSSFNEKESVVIAVTANLSGNIKTRCFEAGMHGFIVKPINKHDLKNIMDLIKKKM